jgi:hypothetical protein
MHPNCGSNKMVTLHHIIGTKSSSPLNGICLCHDHHSTVGHTFEEESLYLKITKQYLDLIGYEPNDKDIEFIRLNKNYE